jgi:EAL domain-containing protein (putative c-di-GMP-specific phosphodiesterase class I)
MERHGGAQGLVCCDRLARGVIMRGDRIPMLTSTFSPPKNTTIRAQILFVDDEPQMTSAIRRVLSREPFDVLVANTIEEAMTLLSEREFDVVVSDELMPDMSGSEFLARVRRDHPRSMRILLTGRANLDTAIHAVNHAGIFRFLQKPCSARDLIENLREAVDQKQNRALQPVSLLPPPDPEILELKARYERAVRGLWVAVQPVVCTANHDVFAYECLVRSREPQVPHGGAFVELAERLGNSKALDRTIRNHVASMLALAPRDLIVLVNLHPSSLDDEDLYNPEAPLSTFASRVVLELTERASLHDMTAVREKVTMLRAMGFRIAVDDLGAGYAGLQSLVILHPEIVKLDMELVRNIDTSPTKAKLVAAVITLCRELGAQVIAEGIETIDEYHTLVSMGCTLMQGYFFARPGRPYPDVSWPQSE